jgi:hypothetical protein
MMLAPLELGTLVEARRERLLDDARREHLRRQLRPRRHPGAHPWQLAALPRPRLRLQSTRQRT